MLFVITTVIPATREVSGGGNVRPTHAQVSDLANLLNKRPRLWEMIQDSRCPDTIKTPKFEQIVGFQVGLDYRHIV